MTASRSLSPRRVRGAHARERVARASHSKTCARRCSSRRTRRWRKRAPRTRSSSRRATYQRAAEAYAAAENDLARGRPQDRVRTDAAAAAKAFRQAKDAAETANVTLASLIKTRADATNANAATFAAQQWTSATERFDSAAQRLETGRHSRRAQPRGRGRGALSRRGAHVDQGAISEPDPRAARRSGPGPRVARSRRRLTRARDRCSRRPSGRSTTTVTTPTCRAASRSRRTTRRGTRSTSRR